MKHPTGLTHCDAALRVHPEVATALAAAGPVVALESTLLAHGLPFPESLETGQRLEAEIRAGGAVPATVAMLEGRLTVGLDAAELEQIARGQQVLKLSRRDLGFAAARQLDGATTVAATLFAAARAGIRVFATGGIGGVHRQAERSFDISADLAELARAPVAVISAGAKSILDLGRTLEVLETVGVPVVGYRTDRFPAFLCRDSGHEVPYRADSAAELAELLAAHWHLGLGGVVVANPIHPRHALPTAETESATATALAEAAEQAIGGKRLTPFLLDRLRQLTEGDSLAANIELVLSNARLGAELAVALIAREFS